MKTFFSDLIPRIQQFSQRLDNLSLLTNNHWVLIHEESNEKYVYIFRSNNDLLFSHNGRVEKGKWEYLGNDALLIERAEGCYLFRHGFFDDSVLALKVDGKEEYAFFVNEGNFKDIASLDGVLESLRIKYLTGNSGSKQKTPESLMLTLGGTEIKYREEVKTFEPFLAHNYDVITIMYDDGAVGTINYSHYYEYYYIEYSAEGKTITYKKKNEAIRALKYYLTHKMIPRGSFEQ